MYEPVAHLAMYIFPTTAIVSLLYVMATALRQRRWLVTKGWSVFPYSWA